MDGLGNKIARRIVGGASGVTLLNSFVYDACRSARVGRPDIAVRAVEYYGQRAEDLIVEALLEATAKRSGVDLEACGYLEIGGNHPFATSNTYLLHRRLGMTGVIVEANPELIDDLEKGRPDDLVVHGAVQTEAVETVKLSISNQSELSSVDRTFVLGWKCGSVGESAWIDVPALRINDVVGQHFSDRTLAYLSIDVEGLDLALLRDLDFDRSRPWFVQAEPSDHHLPHNSERMIEFMDSTGYELVAKTEVNLIFRDLKMATSQ